MNDIALLNLLTRLEFGNYDKDNYCHVCPDCNANFLKYGHNLNCELAQTIRKLGGNVKIELDSPNHN